MTTAQWVIIFLMGMSGIIWLMELLAVLTTYKTMTFIDEIKILPLKKPPKVSVIITACNEADTLEKAMITRLEEQYADLEFILVDDRSTDHSRGILKKIAEKDPRIKLVFIDHLPKGWLGKVHALYTGLKHASGDWLLFSDIDTHVKPGTLDRVISHCLTKQLDHLAIIPEFHAGTFWTDVVVSVFLKALVVTGRSWKIKDNNSKAFGGSGGFNLVKRSAYEKTKGFEWLKMEVVDDLGIGQMIKYSGGNSEMINGRGYVSVKWYHSFKDASIGLGRAMVAGVSRFNFFNVFLYSAFFFVIDMFPFFTLLPLGIPHLQWISGIIILIQLITHALACQFFTRPLLPVLFLPIGNIIAFLNSIITGIIVFFQGGITWRGTFYSYKELRKGQRLEF